MVEERKTSITRLLICFLGINLCYMYYGVIQERLFRPDPRAEGKRFDNTLFLFGIQCLMNALFALIMRTFNGGNSKGISLSTISKTSPFRKIFPSITGWFWLSIISSSYLLAMLTSNEALKYVSYPIQALSKSCKMVPVMLGNVLVGVKYKKKDYLMVFLITLGIALSQHGGDKGKKENSLFGMGLLFTSLAFDGVTGSHQHLFDHEYKLSTHDLMLGMNFFAFLYTFFALIVTGEGKRGIEYVTTYPWIQMDIFFIWFSFCFWSKFHFLYNYWTWSLVCTTITTMRKFFTILVSVFQYADNSFSHEQWLGVFLVFSALGAEIGDKALKRSKQQPASEKKEN